jgi:N-acetyltransferase 10
MLLTSNLLKTELQLPSSQLLALFAKAVRKVCKYLQDLQRSAISAELPAPVENGRLNVAPVAQSIEDELREAGKEVDEEEKARRRELIDGLDLKK